MDVDLGHLSKPRVCGREHPDGIREIRIEPGATARLDDILLEYQYQNPVFICDSSTRAAAEPYLEEEFKDYLVIELDPTGLQADEASKQKILSQVEDCDLGLSSVPVDILVAIGAGTIHDLTRYAAEEFEIPFISVPTAASTAGFSCSMILRDPDGIRKEVPSVAPSWILADTNLFVHAPKRLTLAGVSDVISRLTALADWKVSHLVSDAWFDEEIYQEMHSRISRVIDQLEDICVGDVFATEALMDTLIYFGIMTGVPGENQAVCGAEHHVAHLWKMAVINPAPDALYGESVLTAMFLVLDQYKKMVPAIRQGKLRVDTEESKGIEYMLLERVFRDPEVLEQIIAENTPNPLEDIDLDAFEDSLEAIADVIDSLPRPDGLQRHLRAAGCRTALTQLGLPENIAALSLDAAPYLRGTITLLRLRKLLE